MKKTILILAFFVSICSNANAQKHSNPSNAFDKVLQEEFPSIKTGITVLVSSKGKIIYKKALGWANIELGVAMQTNHVFRIASITKQFTAIAILQLVEQGKLNLQDDIEKYIPGYPVQGHKITIEHLLTHTSGIQDFASMTDTVQRGKIDFSPKEMIDYFKNEPMHFAPGSKYEYSNSNYFLLGYILEGITGKTYGQYLEDHFFRPLGMSNSYYANDSRIIKQRAAGYSSVNGNLQNAAAISMTQPYAAGAIMSTVEDLFKWQQAVQSHQLVKKETLEKAFTRYKLESGKEINYGYGWRMGFIQESESIWHGGLINGFMTMAMYLPKENVYVVVFSNCNGVSTEMATAKLAAIAIGKPYGYKSITVPGTVLETYKGVYENENGDKVMISVEGDKLYFQRGRGPKVLAKAFEKNKFFFDNAMISMKFVKNKSGTIDKLTIHSRSNNEVWKKSGTTVLTQTEINVDEKALEMYTGEYELTPQFRFTVSKEKNRLFVQATGQEKIEMFAEANNKFFLKVNDAQLEFVIVSGKVEKVILKQGGRTTEARRVR